jgi:protein-S-isoprenylcysteine O-methyltransferase Ste14
MNRPIPVPAPPWVRRCGDFLFKYRNAVFPAVFAILVLAAPAAPWMPANIDAVLDIAGLCLAAAGQALRAAVIGLAYIKRGGLNKKIYASSLVTGGIFAVCRNPLYVGNALILGGLLLVCNAPLAYALAGAFFVFAYWCIIRAEETFLLGTFGQDYVEYCRQVHRWLPDLRRLPAATRGVTFNWRRVLMKDYGTFASWMTAVLAMKAYEHALQHHAGAVLQVMAPYAAQIALILAMAGLVRWLKKTGRLREAA